MSAPGPVDAASSRPPVSLDELLNRSTGHDKTDIFRDVIAYDPARKAELAAARALPKGEARAALDRLREGLRPFEQAETAVLVDLLLSYRAVDAWDEMIALVAELPRALAATVLVREQLAFALNRRASIDTARPDDRDRAIAILEEIIGERGANPETNGLLGRIHKDRWQESRETARRGETHVHLARAIAAYADGFLADTSDAFPGINAVSLLDVEGSPASLARRDALLPEVRSAVERRVASRDPDYWDAATFVELAVLASDEAAARTRLADALTRVRESWEPATTAKNLAYILDARRARGEAIGWLESIVGELNAAAAR